MTKSSKEAYIGEVNEKRRLSISKRIRLVYDSTNGSYTAREMALILKFHDHMTTRRRMFDLEHIGYLKLDGTRLENGFNNSVYSVCRSPEIFPNKKKSKFELLNLAIRSHSVDENIILDEYNRLLNYQNRR